MPVHMMISIPPKYAVSQMVGYMKGKSAIHLARVYEEAQLWDSISGQRILRLDRRSRRSRAQGVYPQTRAGEHAARSNEPWH